MCGRYTKISANERGIAWSRNGGRRIARSCEWTAWESGGGVARHEWTCTWMRNICRSGMACDNKNSPLEISTFCNQRCESTREAIGPRRRPLILPREKPFELSRFGQFWSTLWTMWIPGVTNILLGKIHPRFLSCLKWKQYCEYAHVLFSYLLLLYNTRGLFNERDIFNWSQPNVTGFIDLLYEYFSRMKISLL